MRVATKEYSHTPVAFAKERGDCAVRALRIAAGVSYFTAHSALAAHGRLQRHGTRNGIMSSAAMSFGLNTWDLDNRRPTLAYFLRENPTGSYVVQIKGHYIAVRDGIVHNWSKRHGPRTRVRRVWVNQARVIAPVTEEKEHEMSKKEVIEPARSRERVGHTQAEAAATIGVARRTWQDWEGGVAEMPGALLMLYQHLVGLKRIPFKARSS